MKINKDDYVNMPVGFHSVILSTLDETQGAVIENGLNGKRIVITAVAAALVITASVSVALKMNKSGLINKATEDLSLTENSLESTSEAQENEITQTTTLLPSTTQTAETTTKRVDMTETTTKAIVPEDNTVSRDFSNGFGGNGPASTPPQGEPQTRADMEHYVHVDANVSPEQISEIKRILYDRICDYNNHAGGLYFHQMEPSFYTDSFDASIIQLVPIGMYSGYIGFYYQFPYKMMWPGNTPTYSIDNAQSQILYKDGELYNDVFLLHEGLISLEDYLDFGTRVAPYFTNRGSESAPA